MSRSRRHFRSSALALITGSAIILAGCSGSKAPANTGALAFAPPPIPAGGCAYPGTGTSAKNVGTPPTSNINHTDSIATIVTNQGTITIKLDATDAPCTVNSFTYLASKAYFNGTSCHRLTTAGIFVLQCGDPTGAGSGGPGYSFNDENLTNATYPAATVAMANAGPNTNGSQFFLVYKNSPLNPKYTPFGTITSGLDVLNAVANAGTTDGSTDGHPKLPVLISSLTTG